MGKIFHWIYCLPLPAVVTAIIILVILWAVIAVCAERGGTGLWWIWLNRILLVLYLIIIFRMTITGRHPGVAPSDWGLFGKIKAASVQPEYWREMLMNIFLFEPLGLMLPFAFKRPGNSLKPGKRVLIFIITGFLLSAVIEVIQLKLSIGHFEAEDVLCNTIGTAIGTGAFIIWTISRKTSRIRNHSSSR